VKDRIALNMIEEALKKKKIDQNTSIIEPTSGNTGIGLSFVCAIKKIKLILTMPESMSVERRAIIKSFGTEIILTPAHEGMNGAINKAEELSKSIPNSLMLQQFENMDNFKTHEKYTANEILNDMDKNLDYFVSAVGTGGTLTGVSNILKKEINNIKIVAVEPLDSSVLSGNKAGKHLIQGIGAGFIPKILNINNIDEIVKVSNDDAINMAKKLIKEEGIFCGISSGANVYAALEIAKKYENKKILTMICDTAERYLSTKLFS
jgi:cysteine synthase A